MCSRRMGRGSKLPRQVCHLQRPQFPRVAAACIPRPGIGGYYPGVARVADMQCWVWCCAGPPASPCQLQVLTCVCCLQAVLQSQPWRNF